MAFAWTWTGDKRARQMLRSLQTGAPGAARRAGGEVNSRHARAMRGKRIPERTGRYRGSLTQVSHRDRHFRVTDRRIEIGSKVPYAKHQKSRTGRLNRAERQEVFGAPIAAEFHGLVSGKRR